MTAEIRKLDHDDPLLTDLRCDMVQASTKIWAGYWNGELAIIWGIAPTSLLSDTAFIWSRATPVIRQCPKTLLHVTRQWVHEMGEEYPNLIGVTDRKTVFIEHLDAEFAKGPGEFSAFTIRAR